MTRINGKGPKPLMRLSLLFLEQPSPDYSAAVFEVVGGAQDGAVLAIAVTHPSGVPQIALQTLIGGDGVVLAEGPLDARQAMAMLPSCSCGTRCTACAERDPRDRPDHGHLPAALCAIHGSKP